MSFDDFPREAYDSWNEVGLVYTRNKYGRIRSPPGYDLSGNNDCSFKNTLFKGMSFGIDKKNTLLSMNGRNVYLRKFMKII